MLFDGVAGDTVSEMQARLATHVYRKKPTDVVVLGGVNDIAADASSSEIIATLDDIYTDIESNGANVYGATILPFGNWSGYSTGRETVRQEVNAWIMANAATPINLDSVVGTGGTPNALRAQCDSGDGLHPNATGGSAIANAVDTALL